MSTPTLAEQLAKAAETSSVSAKQPILVVTNGNAPASKTSVKTLINWGIGITVVIVVIVLIIILVNKQSEIVENANLLFENEIDIDNEFPTTVSDTNKFDTLVNKAEEKVNKDPNFREFATLQEEGQ